MQSHWDRGKRPQRSQDEKTYRAVSTFDDLEKAKSKARARNLGAYIAELDVPDAVEHTRSPAGHVDLHGTTPEQLLGYVRVVTSVD